MSRNIDLVPLLNWAMERKKEKPIRRGHRSYREQEDPIETLLKMKRFVDEYNKFQADQEKINKKEDKKEEKKKTWWDESSFIQKVAVLTLTVPTCMMGMTIVFLLFAKAVAYLV